MVCDVMHHEQPCLGTALLKRLPLKVVLHGCDASTPLPLTSNIPRTFSLGTLQRVALVFHIGTCVRVPDCRGIFQFRSDKGRVGRSFCLYVACWEVTLEKLPSAISAFTNFAYVLVET